MRKPFVIGIAAGAALILAGVAVLLVTFRGEPPRPPRSAPVIGAAEPLEADSESRPSDQRAASRITPMLVVEESDWNNPIPRSGTSAAAPAVSGEVLDWDGTPAATIDVSVYRLQDGAPVGEACGRGDTDAQGRFWLSVSRPRQWTSSSWHSSRDGDRRPSR